MSNTLLPVLSKRSSDQRSRTPKPVVVCLLGLAIILSACGDRSPGPIADLETTSFILEARAEGERWYDVTESRNAGRTWEQLSPERYGSDDPADPNFGFDVPEIALITTLEVCHEQTCWRAVDHTIERSSDGGSTWATDFVVPEGRDRFAPENYPTIVDMVVAREGNDRVVAAATAENGLLIGREDGTWVQRPIDHWQAPELTGSFVLIWPELTAVFVGSAIALSLLVLLASMIMRRAHEQIAHSIVSLLAVVSVAPAAYYATLPLLDWSDGTIVARQDAIDESISAATFYGIIALVVVVILSLLVRFRWTRRLGALPFPDTPA